MLSARSDFRDDVVDQLALATAHERVLQCVQNPTSELLADPFTREAASSVFVSQSLHQCYWNNRFCIAVSCGLPEDIQRLSAWCAVSNGLNNPVYWEWKTHAGYDMDVVLRRLNVYDSSEVVDLGYGYCRLPDSIARKLIEMFDLPTTCLGVKQELTPHEREQRSLFNESYPYTAIL